MKENDIQSGFWKGEFMLPWKSKANLIKGGARRLPRTLSSMQIILLCGFASIVLLRNTIMSGGFNWSFQLTPEIETSPNSLVSPKRSISQIKEKDVHEQEQVPDQHIFDKATLKQAEDDQVVKGTSQDNGPQEKIVVKEESVNADTESKKEDSVGEGHIPEVTRDDSKENKISHEETTVELNQNTKSENSRDPQLQEKLEAEVEVDEKSQNSQQQRKLEADVKAEETWVPSGSTPKSLGPNPKNWDEQRAAWLEKYPQMKLNSDGKLRMLLVSGSSPWPCVNPIGDHYFVKSIKNKVDYCRQHNIEIFYNIAHLDREMSTFWAKLPILRKLMLAHPEIEWFFWMDADAIFTDMLFEIPMDDYRDYNLIMWGYEKGFYGEKSWVAINNGVFFLRNCQWSLDLFDMWAPMGPEGTVRVEAGKMLSSYLTKRPEMPADDQSALAYLILSKEELQPKVKLVGEYELSGYWADHVTHFEEYMTKDHPGLGDRRWPFTTHFTGCQPCSGFPNPAYEKLGCIQQMERAFNFADNQVLQMLGFMHESLESAHLKRIKEEDDHPLDNVGPNTWTTAAQSYGL